jgi:signal transduction histidine kinase
VAVQGRLVGLIGLGGRLDGEPYAAFDLEYLATAGGMVGVALDNARLYHQILEANRRLLETNQQLSELDRLKSEFLQNVNHELRTPLAVIVGYLDILRQGVPLDENGQQAVAASIRQARKLDGMVQDLLDFSEPIEHVRPAQIETCELTQLLESFVRGRRPGVANDLREITLEVESQLPPARCDRRGLTRVLDELVDNAVKFTPPGSRIVVRAARGTGAGTGSLVVEVEDDGPGIPVERQATLFEAFRQGDGSSTREAGGLGLGLALARRLCEGMQGSIEVTSEPGRGSTFQVRLEAAEPAGA